MGGMQDISQILRCNPALVEEHLTTIYGFLSSAVLNSRSKLARAACQMAQYIFETVQCTTRPVSKYKLRKSSTYEKGFENIRFIIVII